MAAMEKTTTSLSQHNLWWTRHCKKRLRQMFQRIEAERRRDLQTLEHFYYETVYMPLCVQQI
jgi:hypothetical protein